MRSTIHCLTRGLTDRTRQRIEEAGRKLGAQIAFRDGTEKDGHAGLLLAVLSVGQRRLPPDVGEHLGNGKGEGRVLLLCQEPLNRHYVSLHNGRLLLLGLPLTAGRIEMGLKYGLGLAEGVERFEPGVSVEAERSWVVDDLQPPILCRLQQYRGPAWWAAAMCWTPPETGDGAPERLVAIRSRDDRFAALLSLNGEPLAEELASGVLDGLPGDGADPKLRGVLNDSVSAAWLDLQCGCWGLYAPHPSISCLLVSSLRCPACSDLRGRIAGSESGACSLPFVPGDVMLVTSGLSADFLTSLRAACSEGMPRGLRLIRMVDSHWRSRGCPGVGLIVEACG